MPNILFMDSYYIMSLPIPKVRYYVCVHTYRHIHRTFSFENLPPQISVNLENYTKFFDIT